MPRYFFHPLNYWDISQQCTPNINWHQSYYNHGIASPYRLLGKVCCAAKSLRSLRIYICSGRGWAVQILYSDMGFVWYMALVCFLHFNLHLVGLRRMRLCLILRSGLCPKNPQGTLSLDPASPLTPGLSLRLSVRYARCWVYNSGRLCPFLIPHSSFLTPHSSFLTPHLNRFTAWRNHCKVV